MSRLFLLLLPALLFGQSTGTILGTVSDSTGAVVPATVMKVVNILTSQQWEAASDAAGRFGFPRLPVGDYKLEASHAGFRQFRSEAIHLDADQTRAANIVLEIGQTSESVTVTGAVGLVETVGGTIKEVVDEKRINELPLNGRNPLQLQLLIPGAVPSTGSVSLAQNTTISVNGARGNQNNYMLDGGDNNDPLTNSASIVPNPDALEEFSILTNNFSAEYGRNTGAVVNAITKSGTNEYHASLYEFVRNDAFDARNFFSLVTPKLRRNQFGGTLGGPVQIPRIFNGHDRTFFFFSYEGVRERRANTFSSLVVPTALERAGNFSQSARKPTDPLTKSPFPGGIIPATRFDAAAVNFINALVPLPNTPSGQHIFNTPQNLDADQIMARGDHQITSKQRLTARVFYEWESTFLTAGLPKLHSSTGFHTYNVMANHTDIISPGLLNTAQFTFGRVLIERGPLPVEGDVTYQSLGLKVHSDTPQFAQNWRGSVSGFWNMNQDNQVNIDRRTYQATEQLSWTHGGHMVKLGGEVRFTQSDRVTANLTDPQFTFNGTFAVNPFADFLLGLPANMNQGSLRQNQGRGRVFSLFIQDDWKVRSDLTLSIGLRYEPFFPLFDAGGQMSVFRAGQQSTVYPTAPVGLLYAGDPGVPRGGAPNDWNNLGPRFGFAWSPFSSKKTSVRGAYGIFYDTPDYYQLTAFANTQPFSMQLQVNQPYSFSDPYHGRADPFPYKPPATQEERKKFAFTLPATIGESLDAHVVDAYVQQWNFNIQQETVKHIVLTAGYVGSKGTHQPLQRELNPAIYRPGATLANIDQRRIYAPALASIADYESIGFSSYHALQLSLNKRFSGHYTVLANYTFAKSLDNGSLDTFGGWQNPMDLRAEKGPSDYDVRKRFVASFLYQVHSPPARRAKAILGGWQVNGIFTAQSGTPFNVVSGKDQALSGTGSQRPNLVGSPNPDTGRSRAELIEQYFNPAAFALPAVGQYGNLGRNTMYGPGRWNLDASVFRNFDLREHMRLQFRAESFNTLNHANLGNPVANIGTATVGRILSATEPRILQLALKLIY
ncbi:MAG: TonB-dependent receptor [Bryobacterales bacterium]|nr:TonB-dependent receptor [Bryobacterales bacterium]